MTRLCVLVPGYAMYAYAAIGTANALTWVEERIGQFVELFPRLLESHF